MSLSPDVRALAFEHAPIGLVVTESRVIKGCNPAFAEMFGYGVGELLEQSFALLYPSIEEFERLSNREPRMSLQEFLLATPDLGDLEIDRDRSLAPVIDLSDND